MIVSSYKNQKSAISLLTKVRFILILIVNALSIGIEVYLSDIISYSESFGEKLKLIMQSTDRIFIQSNQARDGYSYESSGNSPDENQTKYISLFIVLLLKLMWNNPKVKLPSDKSSSSLFFIENEEFKIAQELLFKWMKSKHSIRSLTYLILLISFVSIFHSSKFGELNLKVTKIT